MRAYQPYPLFVPNDGQHVWCIAFYFYSTPFQAVYNAGLQIFTDSSNGRVYPAYVISRWKDNSSAVPANVEYDFHASDYNISYLNPSAVGWLATTTTSFLSVATSNRAMLANGYIVADINAAAPANVNGGLLGLKSFAANTSFMAVPTWDYTLRYTTIGNNYIVYFNGVIVNNATPCALNDRPRLKRTNGIVTAEYYRGGVWNVLYTFLIPTYATLYPCLSAFNSTAPSSIKVPKILLDY